MPTNAPQNDGFALAVSVEGGLALLAVILAWLFGVPVGDQVPRWGAPLGWAVARGLMVTVPMLAVFWWLMHWDRPALRRLREQVQWLVGEMFPHAGIGQLALVALLAGVGEELLFRGVVQWLAVEWTSPLVGLMLASLLFGAAHALSKLYFLFATVIGFAFGGLVLAYNDLVAPMVAHSLYDFVALVYISRSRLRAKD